MIHIFNLLLKLTSRILQSHIGPIIRYEEQAQTQKFKIINVYILSKFQVQTLSWSYTSWTKQIAASVVLHYQALHAGPRKNGFYKYRVARRKIDLLHIKQQLA